MINLPDQSEPLIESLARIVTLFLPKVYALKEVEYNNGNVSLLVIIGA